MAVDPKQVDIRLAVGEPKGEQPIRLQCSMHMSRLGTEDENASLCVYRANIHCMGCHFHITRRYASLAFLLDLWDGRGDEDGPVVTAAVKKMKARLAEFMTDANPILAAYVPPPPDPTTVEAFHQYLLRYGPMDELTMKRGLSLATIRRFKLGYTGTHFTLPVFTVENNVSSIRYRADAAVVDTNGEGFKKYDGTWGRNQPVLYPLPIVRGLRSLEELFVVEGEFDAIATNQAGAYTLTVTNGAGAVARIAEMISQQLPSLRVGRWVIATDQDQAGEECASRLIRSLTRDLSVPRSRVARARWEYGKDPCEYFAYGGELRGVRYD